MNKWNGVNPVHQWGGGSSDDTIRMHNIANDK